MTKSETRYAKRTLNIFKIFFKRGSENKIRCQTDKNLNVIYLKNVALECRKTSPQLHKLPSIICQKKCF